ncbi:MAG: hypothetical protein WBX22_16705, partial [Silvibacterium sp.]
RFANHCMAKFLYIRDSWVEAATLWLLHVDIIQLLMQGAQGISQKETRSREVSLPAESEKSLMLEALPGIGM